jgi:hypothetical protein
MSPSSTSNSKTAGWSRLRREILRVVVVFVLLECIARIGPVKTWLSYTLDPYENLLWYSENMPSYQDQLLHGPHYDVWLGGSSYMMTSLQPDWIKNEAAAQGIDGLSFQNYGLNTMQNLNDMAAIYDRWMFRMDQPQYMILGISLLNFTQGGRQPSRARSSPMERTYIFPDSVDDYIAGWLFQHSRFYHYALLARNATFIPRDQALLKSMPLGGYAESSTTFNCDSSAWLPPDSPSHQSSYGDFSALGNFIDVIRARNIPVIVVNIPLQYCSMRNGFADYADYIVSYLKPVGAYLEAMGVPFLDLDTQFRAQVPDDEQFLYFRDTNHPNIEGAKRFSQWTADFFADWMKSRD